MKKHRLFGVLLSLTMVLTACSGHAKTGTDNTSDKNQIAQKNDQNDTGKKEAEVNSYREVVKIAMTSDAESYPSISAMEQVSDCIIHGKVEKVTTKYEEGNAVCEVNTVATIKVSDVLKGKVEDSIELSQFGGIYDGKLYEVKDTQKLMCEGEEYLLFLKHSEDGSYYDISPWCGRFRIVDGHYDGTYVTDNAWMSEFKKTDASGILLEDIVGKIE